MSIIKKDYFTFRELCNRWKINDQDMHYLVVKGELVPSIAWNQCLVECNLMWVTDGDPEFNFPDRHKYIEKGGWLYLHFPKPAGHSAYSFTYASRTLSPPKDDFVSEETCYMLCGYCEYEGTFPPESVGETYVEAECVFMVDSVAACEAKHPELTESANRVISPAANTSEQNNAGGKWPWGNYETELLRKLSAAANKFWTLYDPADQSTAPTNQQVIDWLIEQDVSKRNAEAMATILRADGLPTGPRK